MLSGSFSPAVRGVESSYRFLWTRSGRLLPPRPQVALSAHARAGPRQLVMAIHSPVVRFATRSIPMSRPSSPVRSSRSGRSGQRQISATSNSGSCSAMRMKSCSNRRPFSDWSRLSLRIRAMTSPAPGRPCRSRLSYGVGMVVRTLGLACRGSRNLLGRLRSFSRLRPMCRHGPIPRWPFRADFGFAVGVSWVALPARDDGMSAPAPWLYLDADGFFASCEEAADAPWSLSTGRRAARGWPHRVARWGPVPVRSGRRVAPPLCEGPSVRRWALDRVHGAPVRAGPF